MLVVIDVKRKALCTSSWSRNKLTIMAMSTVVSSADKLIGEIREMYNISRKSALKMSCELIDEKIAQRESAKREKLSKECCARTAREGKSEKYSRPAVRSGEEKSVLDDDIVLSKGSKDKACMPRDAVDQKGGVKSCCANLRHISAFPENCPTAVRTVKQPRYRGLPKVFNAMRNDTLRIIGEVAFQLEKRIILHVFPDADQVYRGTLDDIRRVIRSEPDEEMRARYVRALHCCIQRLEPLGWDINFHVDFGNEMMAKYGVGAPAFLYEERDQLAIHAQLARLIAKELPLTARIQMITILSCLLSLAMKDQRPLFLTTKGEEFKSMQDIIYTL